MVSQHTERFKIHYCGVSKYMSTNERVEFGVAIPQIFPNGTVDMDSVRDGVAMAEAHGYHSIWVQDGIVGDSPILEAVGLLCYVAALSTRPKLGVSVLVTPLRNPVQLAKILSSLDQMSGGRLIIGIGMGRRPAPFREDLPPNLRHLHHSRDYPAFGIPTERLVGRFVEGLDVMKALWANSLANYCGDIWRLDGIAMEPKPVQKPHPPIWFGGRHPDSLRRAVRHADGWMGAGGNSTAQFKEGVAVLMEAMENQKRDPSTFLISKRVYIAVDEDEKRAERRLREWFERASYKNANLGSEVCVWGSAARCTEQLAEITAAGARLVVFNPMFDSIEQMDCLAKEIIPHLRVVG